MCTFQVYIYIILTFNPIFIDFFVEVCYNVYIFSVYMKKIDKFSTNEIHEIRSIFPLVCEEIPHYNGKELCPKCKVHHKRLPSERIFKELISLYDATDKAWSEIFFTDRASVTNLRKKYSLGSYNVQQIWDSNRFWDELDEGIDFKPVEDFLELLTKYPRADEKTLMEIAEINKYYFTRLLRNNFEIQELYNNIKSVRNLENEYLFCIRCKIRKKKNYFKPISQNKLKRSIICDLCNKENIDKCTHCGKIYPESKLEKKENGILICKKCSA